LVEKWFTFPFAFPIDAGRVYTKSAGRHALTPGVMTPGGKNMFAFTQNSFLPPGVNRPASTARRHDARLMTPGAFYVNGALT